MLRLPFTKPCLLLVLLTALPSLAWATQDFVIPEPVPHSDVRDQGKSGFCWAYSTTAMLEAELLRERGIRVDLSEEYLGFFHIYDQLLRMAPHFFQMEKSVADDEANSRPLRDLLNGALVTFFFHPSEGAPDLELGMDLIEKYGIVPEAAFRYKAEKGVLKNRVEGRIRRFINQTLRDPLKNKEFRKQNTDGSYSYEPLPSPLLQALARVYTDESHLPDSENSVADTLLKAYHSGFNYDGLAYDPKAFARDHARFTRSDYKLLEVTPENEAERIALLRETLSKGQSVQLGFMLYQGYSSAAQTTGILQNSLCNEKACPPAGGHAVLIVNEALRASTGDLAGFVIQNSWGPVGLDSRGRKGEEKGFQILTLDYVRRIYTLKETDLKNRHWSFLVKQSAD